jgi:hypothetical protein
MAGNLMSQEEYLAEEAHEFAMQREFEEWGADDFSFPWLDCVSTNQFSKLMAMPEFWKAIA